MSPTRLHVLGEVHEVVGVVSVNREPVVVPDALMEALDLMSVVDLADGSFHAVWDDHGTCVD